MNFCLISPKISFMAIYSFNGFIPVVKASSFIHPQACVTGNVIIGEHVYIGPGAAIRGDWGQIIIEDGCNVQENCVVHMFPGTTVHLKKGAHVGHGAIIHGGTLGENCLIGMNAVIYQMFWKTIEVVFTWYGAYKTGTSILTMRSQPIS